MKASLEYTVNPENLEVIITYQRYRGDSFNNGCWYFTASNGVKLNSDGCPAMYDNGRSIFLRGTNRTRDSTPLKFRTRAALVAFMDAVVEYIGVARVTIQEVCKKCSGAVVCIKHRAEAVRF